MKEAFNNAFTVLAQTRCCHRSESKPWKGVCCAFDVVCASTGTLHQLWVPCHVAARRAVSPAVTAAAGKTALGKVLGEVD